MAMATRGVAEKFKKLTALISFCANGGKLSTEICKCLEDDRAGGILLCSDSERPACRTPHAECEGDDGASLPGSIPADAVWGHGTD